MRHSSIPSFATNITSHYRLSDDKILIPIMDSEANVPFYAIYRKKNRKCMDAIRGKAENI